MPYLLRVLSASTLILCLATGIAQAQSAPPPTAVTVVEMQPQSVTLTTTLPGRVAASAEAEVRPQVNGIITERFFREGGHVNEGDPLFRIDPDTYAAVVQQAQASVKQVEVEVKFAKTEVDRVTELRQNNVASQQALDNVISTYDSALAALEVAKAQLNAAEIDLARTTINAQLSGEIGLAQVSHGALVTASQASPLAVIRDIDPVYVDVTQSASDLLRWQRGQTELDLADADRTVRLTLADGSDFRETGTLTAAEHNVNPQTGVVTLRMQFANPDRLLLPGMYVQVDLPVELADDVYLVPQEGVNRDRRGRPIAWVVNADNVVEERQLSILQDRNADWVVNEGLAPGDRLIVAGFQKTAPGATVTPEPRPAE
ncbi:efflux RND transporter periplasmic adaptor subunit [Actibacterium ureilyticum]|uniref:efflux RND transporter periplasmic adaptor subunit n=1 Tax=Actibacterium ureilyticum TaxID=1590614 RepID=UPI000BAAF049|nr:efflux RND transporter periplasmic adaptor subunit [Actibacterium ureilyticum]